MNSVQERASLHEKAVQKVARGEHKPPRRRRKRASGKNERVRHVKVHPLIAEYLREQGIPLSKVQVCRTDDVIVWNNPHNHPSADPVRFIR